MKHFFMKYFVFVIFVFSALVLNAQMNIEEIAYVPSPTGYYNSLIVKGNAKIKELRSRPFNIHSYSSFLTVNVSSTTSSLFINKLIVSTGTAALLANKNNATGPTVTPPQGSISVAGSNVAVRMNGGSLSVSKTLDASAGSKINIDTLTYEPPISTGSTINFFTQDVYNDTSKANFLIVPHDSFYIFGMKVPPCEGRGYYWQDVKVANTTFTVLACNTTNCEHPEDEEECLNRPMSTGNWSWNQTTCHCDDGAQPGGGTQD